MIIGDGGYGVLILLGTIALTVKQREACHIPSLRTVDSHHYMGRCYGNMVRYGKRHERALPEGSGHTEIRDIS